MPRYLLPIALAAAAVLGAAPAHAGPADPVPDQLRPHVILTVDPDGPSVGAGLTIGTTPVGGASVDGKRGRACAGYGDTTGFCTDQVTDRVKEIVDLG